MLYLHGIATFFSSDALARRTKLIERGGVCTPPACGPKRAPATGRRCCVTMRLERLPQMTTPTLVLAGEEDYFTSYYPLQVHERIPNSRFVYLTGAGSSHGLLWDGRPKRILRSGTSSSTLARHLELLRKPGTKAAGWLRACAAPPRLDVVQTIGLADAARKTG